MCLSHHPKANLLSLWLVFTVLLPAPGFAGVAETLSQPTPKELVSPSMHLQVPRPLDVLVPPPMNLQFQIMDLKLAVEDVLGTVQTLAMKETKTEITIELSGDVLFEFDKADIRPAAEPALQRVVEIIQQYPWAGVSIDGYTDAKGVDAYNLQLFRQMGGLGEKLVRQEGRHKWHADQDEGLGQDKSCGAQFEPRWQ
jgi:flagellar motor protein MotB